MEDLQSLLSKVDNSKSKPSDSFLINLFRELRKTKLSRPDIVLKYGPKLLNKVSSTEKYNLLEQIFLDAVFNGYDTLADEYLEKLQIEFPKSGRVGRLFGLKSESEGKYDKAFVIYDELLKENPANLLLMKRKVN